VAAQAIALATMIRFDLPGFDMLYSEQGAGIMQCCSNAVEMEKIADILRPRVVDPHALAKVNNPRICLFLNLCRAAACSQRYFLSFRLVFQT
jgi:hypothetical protein